MNDRSTGETAMLVMTDEGSSTRWALRSGSAVIGRDPASDIVISDRQISRRHAEIVRRGDQFVLRDCGSKNGTFVNGEKVSGDYTLQDGDEIQIALCCHLVFVGPGATAPLVLDATEQALTMDEKSYRTWVRGIELHPPLSPAQFRLLWLLWNEPGRVFTREEIIEAVWPGEEGEGVSEQALDALVRRLRERLAPLGGDELVGTVRGHGFRLNLP